MSNMISNLEGVKIYLSGAIDRIEDDGVGWRKEFRQKCVEYNLPVSFLDPTNKPDHLGSEIGEEKNRIKMLLESCKWNQAKNQAKIFRRIDLRMVDICHLFIVHIDVNCHLCGTYEELFTAERQRKPMLAIMASGQSKWDIPSWLVSIFDEEDVFNDVESCVEHLKLLHTGKIIFDDRWIMI